MKACASCSRCLDDDLTACPDDGGTTLPEVLPGSRLIDGTYELERRLGEGGMGVVFRARHVSLDRRFAVKLIRGASALAPEFIARFRTEALALGRLKHPGIVDVTDFGVDPREGGVPYLVMELLEGVSLETHLDRVGRLPIADSLRVLEEIAEAVDFAHAQGVLHRDLKPLNVLLATDGHGSPRVKLLDFGLALLDPHANSRGSAGVASLPSPTGREPTVEVPLVAAPGGAERATLTVRPDLASDTSAVTGLLGTRIATGNAGSTRPGELIGTPTFMAPERFRGGAVTGAADVYALGVVAFVLFTGRPPFSGSLDAVMRGHLEEQPPRPSKIQPDLPPGIDAPLLRALAKQPDQRPATARAFVNALREAARSHTLRRWRRSQRPRWIVTALALGLVAASLLSPLLSVRPIADLERAAIDARFASAPERPLDPRILVVLLDEASLADERRPLSDLADVVADRLERSLAAGARAVAIDLIAPASWGRSGRFVRLVAGHPHRVVLAAHGTTDAVIGTEALAGLATAAMGEEAAGRLFGLVNLEEDADGVVRRGRLRFATRDGGFIDSWAAAAVRALVGGVPGVPPSHAGAPRLAPLGTFFIDFTAASGTDAVIAWNEWDGLLAREPSRLDGRLVVLGARLAGTGDDVLRVPPGPGGPSFMPGALIQARAVDTILSGFPVRELQGPILIVIVALGVTVMVVGLLQASTPTESLALAGAIVVVYLGFSWMAFRQGGFLVPVAAPLALLLLAAAAALALRSVHPLSDPSGGS